jgi:hypothetical protein
MIPLIPRDSTPVEHCSIVAFETQKTAVMGYLMKHGPA